MYTDNVSFTIFVSLQVTLGVLLHNENTTEGITEIMHELHKYVPGHDADAAEDMVPIISGGDLLTAERESNVQDKRIADLLQRRDGAA